MKNNIKNIFSKDRFVNLMNREGTSSLLSSLLSIAIGLLIGFIIMMFTNFTESFGAFGSILAGGFGGGLRGIGNTFFLATPIILTGLSVGFAFKTGLFNIGASGQFLVGSFGAIWVATTWTFLPAPLHWIVALLVGFIFGGLWATLSGVLKALLNVHEVISTIMMNYIGLYLVNMILPRMTQVYSPVDNRTNIPAHSAALPRMGLDKLFVGSSMDIGIIIAIIVAIVIYLVLYKTKFGYELRACGFNKNACRYAGIDEKKSIILSMVISGALAGLGGSLLILSKAGRHIEAIDILPAEGFNGISVALLGLSNPIGIIFTGIFIAYLSQGGFYMQLYDFEPQIIDMIIAIIIYASALSLIIKLYFNKRNRQRLANIGLGDKKIDINLNKIDEMPKIDEDVGIIDENTDEEKSTIGEEK